MNGKRLLELHRRQHNSIVNWQAGIHHEMQAATLCNCNLCLMQCQLIGLEILRGAHRRFRLKRSLEWLFIRCNLVDRQCGEMIMICVIWRFVDDHGYRGWVSEGGRSHGGYTLTCNNDL